MSTLRDLRLTSTGDIEIPVQYVTGAECVRQRIGVRLGIFRGEPLFDAADGVPWFDWLSTRKNPPSMAALGLLVQAQLLAIPDIIGATVEAEQDARTRTISITASCQLADGSVAVYEITPPRSPENPGGIWIQLIRP